MRYNNLVDLRKLGKGLLWTALILGVVGGALRLLLVRTWTVPSDDPVLSASIAPSLAPGDFVLLLHAGSVGFGDLVRCTDPDEPRRWIIGRIAGESGDTVEINQGRVTVNGVSAAIEHACVPNTLSIPDPNTGSAVDLRCDMEDLGGNVHMRGAGAKRGMGVDAPIKRTVQAGFFFLVSDNRTYPSDSRTFGAVPIETCDARIIIRIWSADGFGDAEKRLSWID